MRIKLYKTIAIIMLLPFCALANPIDGKFTKERKIQKTYLVNTEASLDVINTYGSINISVWNENKTSIEVTIKVSGNNKDEVEQKFESISVLMGGDKNNITAKTVFGRDTRSRSSMNIEVNYAIKIPKNGNVKLNNKYGGIIIDKLWGKSDIVCRYGPLSINELQNDMNAISLEYSNNSSFGYIKGGNLVAKYSDFIITKADKLVLKSDYTSGVISNVSNLNYTAEYGKIKVDNADQVDGSGDYLTIVLGDISKQLNLTTSYSRVSVNEMGPKAKDVKIAAKYTNIKIGHNPNYAFDFEFNLKYGNLKSNSNLEIQTKKEVNNKTSYYKGYYKSSGVNSMNIDTEYGNINITKN
ncbi:hypothetical protein [Flavobacterium sp. '19STA2R22 D10 B1']|uniref:hypothetical protein n=1 Tax=Flavobacterium aerium TaxID=3037261 RepID=UPI00278C2E7F|nr:hypothetical protein [Flavobacterium sp. '19STA2R22 D10 B1']